ncbi:MAG: methyltransferase domain-containing protein [Spirochaetales bacterium]|nr:methyltransferase domain-containing protein [Spirochaetales bacterium]
MTNLIIPSVRKSNGTGHLKRCILLAEQLVEQGDSCEFYLSLNDSELQDFKARFAGLNQFSLHNSRADMKLTPDRIIMDNRETSYELWAEWEDLAPLIFLDEGGEARNYASYLIDSLPHLAKGEANIKGSPLFDSYTDLQERGKGTSLLISFGGEDPAELTEPTVREILKTTSHQAEDLIVVQGPMAKDFTLPVGVRLVKNPPNLAPLFKESKLVITSFGLTPYEAERAGVPVILINPAEVHEKVSPMGGFRSLGIGQKGISKIGAFFKEGRMPSLSGENRDLPLVASLISRLGDAPQAHCPLCGKRANPVIKRFSDRSFYHCGDCDNYYLVNWNREEEVYDRDYFFDKYKAQYGKTYLDDFNNIKRVSKVRLAEVKAFLKVNKDNPPLLTDLGCAFGPFLAAAQEEGFQCRGVEINDDGAAWIEENLKIPVIRGSLEDENVIHRLRETPGDVTTLWYVIEHFGAQKELLGNINKSLKIGGVLAFGTPSGKGISARKSLFAFLEASPADHYVIYTPRGARKILSRHGFKVLKVKSVGHHPERFASWVGKKGSFTYNALMLISRWFSLGDSLEIYAVKTAEQGVIQ